MIKEYVVIGIIISAMLSGCATPQSLKSLSSEQVKVQGQTKASLQQYFSIIEQLVTNVIDNLKREEGIALKEEKALYQNKFKSESGKTGADIDALSKQLADDIEEATKKSIQAQETFDKRLNELKAKHKEILLVFDALEQGQKTIDNYIQLEKADEAVANLLYSKLGVSEKTVTSYANSISEIVNF